ncbi:ABC transporter substrate-binding protein [Dehalococcoidia bacterium]|nr:ABC transporter substrate-binding protein [Dehalococcoidia bacterium]
MSRQVKVMLAVVAMLVVLMPVLVACPPVVEEVPTIRIGIIGPMKFLPGEHTWWGAQLAAEEINAAGGVNVGGVMHQIELVKADSNELLSVIDAVSAMERLTTVDEVDFIIGGVRSEAVLAKQEVMADHRVIFINSGSAHLEQTMRVAADYERYRYFFRTGPVNSRYLGKMIFALMDTVAGEVRQELGIETPKVALMMEKAVWTDPIVAAAKELLPQLGMEVVGVWRPSPTAADVTAELTAIKDAGAHIIMTAYLGPVGVTASRQWGELEIPAAKVGINTEAQSKRHWEATGGEVEWEVTFNLIGPVEMTPKTIPFFTRVVERFGDFPYYTTTSTYDTVYLLKEAIERAGTLETYAVIDELKKTDFLGTMGRIAFTGMDSPYPHDLVWGPEYVTGVGIQWRDGELVVVWPDGRAVLGDKAWEGVRFEGTVDYKLPPWMVEFWKGRQ